MKIVQLINNDKTLVGLGDDGKIYKFNHQIGKWELMG